MPLEGNTGYTAYPLTRLKNDGQWDAAPLPDTYFIFSEPRVASMRALGRRPFIVTMSTNLDAPLYQCTLNGKTHMCFGVKLLDNTANRMRVNDEVEMYLAIKQRGTTQTPRLTPPITTGVKEGDKVMIVDRNGKKVERKVYIIKGVPKVRDGFTMIGRIRYVDLDKAQATLNASSTTSPKKSTPSVQLIAQVDAGPRKNGKKMEQELNTFLQNNPKYSNPKYIFVDIEDTQRLVDIAKEDDLDLEDELGDDDNLVAIFPFNHKVEPTVFDKESFKECDKLLPKWIKQGTVVYKKTHASDTLGLVDTVCNLEPRDPCDSSHVKTIKWYKAGNDMMIVRVSL